MVSKPDVQSLLLSVLMASFLAVMTVNFHLEQLRQEFELIKSHPVGLKGANCHTSHFFTKMVKQVTFKTILQLEYFQNFPLYLKSCCSFFVQNSDIIRNSEHGSTTRRSKTKLISCFVILYKNIEINIPYFSFFFFIRRFWLRSAS